MKILADFPTQVVSVYLDAEIRDGVFDYVFFSVFVWACATWAVVFYGVDTVDREGNAWDRNGNFLWLQVSLQIKYSLILSPLIGLDIDMELGFHVGSLGAKNGDAYQGECKDRIQIEDQVLHY